MTRKDYQLIADAINKSVARSHIEVDDSIYLKLSDVIVDIGRALEEDNDKFHMGKFVRACKGIAQ